MRQSLFITMALLSVAGCSASNPQTLNPLGNYQSPDRLTLFSVDPNIHEPGQGRTGETFHGYPVLGQIEITDAAERRKLMAALNDAYTRRPDGGMACFDPRHGIRVTAGNKTVEYLICFQCNRFTEFVPGRAERDEFLNRDVQPTFDKPLKDAGIAIAP